MMLPQEEKVLILDFGSQYTQLIARRIRELKVYCEIVPFSISPDRVRSAAPKGLILSGGPSSVYAEKAPLPDPRLFQMHIPVLGICYGLQVVGHLLGGEVGRAVRREFGRSKFVVNDAADLFFGIPEPMDVWMSHGDRLDRLPEGFDVLGHTENAGLAAVGDRSRRIWGIQFHPEVVHTPHGSDILKNFVLRICGCKGLWTPRHFVTSAKDKIREQVGDGRVLCALSGGVDSAVTAALIHQAVGDRLICVFVDNGLLRQNEAPQVARAFPDLHLCVVDATKAFLKDLAGVVDPEEKRKRIGKRFIRVFEAEAKRQGRIDFLAQGTLYPDVIESTSTWGPSATIKSHHNVGGLPERMHLTLVEPLRELFKDEVRAVGKVLGIPETILERHPFPGPGLAIRILGEITPERLDLLRRADAVFMEELKRSGWYGKVWQALVVLLPVQSVGVMGDERTYEFAVVLRAVTSLDGMTADWAKLPPGLLARVSNRIINEIRGINRVVYDISSKPPSTIEWE